MQTYKDTISYFLRFCKQSLHHIRLFPRQIQFRAAKVAVTGGLTVDRAAQIERLDDGRRAQVEAFAHKLGQLIIRDLAGSICLDENGNRVRHADGVGQLQLAYAIGVAHPVSVLVETYGTGKIADDKLAQLVRECFDLRPAAIIKTLDLRRPIYRQTAGYGHFGRAELDLPWEKTDMVQTLLAKA